MRVRQIDTDKQNQVIKALKDLICPHNKTAFTLYDIDHDPALQSNILALIPDIRAQFYLHNFTGVSKPDSLKRPWLSLIKAVLGKRYDILIEDYRDKQRGIRTKRYHLQERATISI